MKSYFKLLKNYFNFGGYTSRPDFWIAIIIHNVIYVIIWGASLATGVTAEFNLILAGYSILMLIPILSVIVRRLRDAGKSALNLLWMLVPLIGQIVLLVKLVQPTLGDREFRRG